jgi:hypothetical protein
VLRASRLGEDARNVDFALLNELAGDLLGHELEIDEDTFRKALDPVAFVAAHAVTAGPAPVAVRESVASARATLDERKRAVEGRSRRSCRRGRQARRPGRTATRAGGR